MFTKIKDFIFKIIYILIIIYLILFVPSMWGFKPLVVYSGSMEPTLKVGSLFYYQKQDIEEFQINDILVYETKEHIISHRIIDKLEEGFITKGDANNIYDSNVVKEKQVLGKGTEWCIPLIGYYADYVYNHKYLLFVALALSVIDLLIDIYKTHKMKVGKKNEENN